MADTIGADVFGIVLGCMCLAWLATVLLTYRTAVARGHAFATQGHSIQAAMRPPCAARLHAAAVRPGADAPTESVELSLGGTASEPAATAKGSPRVPPISMHRRQASGDASAEETASAGPGGLASGRGSLASARARSARRRGMLTPGSAASTSRRRAMARRSTPDDTSHVDDGDAILRRARDRQAAAPRTEAEALDATLAQVSTVKWSDVRTFRECGHGAFGTVYRGEFIGLDVAIKVANDDVIDDEGFIMRFHRECGILAQLHHPNVLSLQGIVFDPPARRYAIITPFCPNGDLMSFIAAPPDVLRGVGVTYGMKTVIRFATDIARGCRFLHLRARVIQRDLKLANVLVDRFCNALLADFGLSRILRSDDGGAARPLTPCGSPAWTAPEIVKMQPYTNKVDVFSFGIMLWQLIAREEPYKDRENNLDLALEVAEEGLRPRIPTFCPPDYTDLMTQCWAANPDDRPGFDKIQERLTAMRKAHGAEVHRIALMPDLDAVREAHQEDLDRAMAGRAGSRSARSEGPMHGAAAAAAGAASAAAPAATSAAAPAPGPGAKA